MTQKRKFWGCEFTLLELVIVIALIGLLLWAVTPLLGCAGNIYVDKSIHLNGDGNELLYEQLSDTELNDVKQDAKADGKLQLPGPLP